LFSCEIRSSLRFHQFDICQIDGNANFKNEFQVNTTQSSTLVHSFVTDK